MNPLETLWQTLRQPLRFGTQIFAFSPATIIFEFLLPLLVFFVLAYVFRKWLQSYLGTSSVNDSQKARITRIARLVLRSIFVIMFALLGSRFLELRLLGLIEDMYTVVSRPFYKSGSTELSILTLVLAVPILYLANLAGKAVKLAFEKSKFLSKLLDDGRRQTLAGAIRYGVMALTGLLGMSIIGFDLSSIGVFLAISFAGLLLGLQTTLANFFAGFGLLANRPISEGDFVQIEHGGTKIAGMVEQIRLLHVVLESDGGIRIQVPSAQVYHGIVHVEGKHDELVPLLVKLELAPGTDLLVMEKAVLEVCSGIKNIKKDSKAELLVLGVAHSKLVVQIAIPLEMAAARRLVLDEFWRGIYTRFRKEGISFA